MVTSAAAKPASNRRCHCGADAAFAYFVDGRWQRFCAEHRLRQWSADACRSETESARVQAELGIEQVDASDLQVLIVEHNGYDKIPPEAWVEFDRAMTAWQVQRREKYKRH